MASPSSSAPLWSAFAAIAVVTMAMAATPYRPAATARVVDPIDDGLGPLAPLVHTSTFGVEPGALVVPPGGSARLSLAVPDLQGLDAVTLRVYEHTDVVVRCARDERSTELGRVTLMTKATFRLAVCPAGAGDRSVEVSVTNLAEPGTIALGIDTIEFAGLPASMRPATWVSLVALLVAFTLCVHLTADGWPARVAPVLLAAWVSGVLVGRDWALPARPLIGGGYFNPALEAAACLTAGAYLLRARSAWARQLLPWSALLTLTALATVTRWVHFDAVQHDALWPDVEYVRGLVAAARHPYDTGTREPFWPWLVWIATAAFGDTPITARALSVAGSIVSIPATYVLAYTCGRSQFAALGAAGLLAVHPFLAAASPQGHRTEWLVLEYLAVTCFACAPRLSTRARIAGLALSLAALVLTSLSGAVTAGGLLCLNLARRRMSPTHVAAVAVFVAVLLVPYVAHNLERYGTYSWFSSTGVPTFFRNYEFVVVRGTGCEGCPTREGFEADAYAGRPIGMAHYLFGLHSTGEVVRRLVTGTVRALVERGPELAALIGDESTLRWCLYLAGIVAALLGPMRELLLVPLLSLNLAAFVVPLGVDPRLFAPPAGIAMVLMALPLLHLSHWLNDKITGARRPDR